MMCSVCEVREQRDDDEFMPCSPYCLNAWTLWHAERMRAACIWEVENGLIYGCTPSGEALVELRVVLAALREVQL